MKALTADWDAFGEKAQWDIKVALRGPDSNYGETLKWFTTSVIRGHCSQWFRVGGLVNKDLKLVILPSGSVDEDEKPAFRTRTAWNYQHFCDHVMTAANWLGLPTMYIEAAVWHKVMRKESALQAGQAILAAVEKWSQADVEPFTRRALYNPKLVEELQRHLNEGRIQF